MKEKDLGLGKHLNTVIIDGLIKEAEQESAEFAAAMRKIRKEDFEAIVNTSGRRFRRFNLAEAAASACVLAKEDEPEPPIPAKRLWFKRFGPWIAAAVSAAAVILFVLIPSFNSMDAKLCDSALYMSEAYITAPKGGFDVSTATDEQIRNELPALEQRFAASYTEEYRYITHTEDFQDAGWTLVVAYLKLHKKDDAVRVLHTLASQTKGTPFGNHCEALLKQLE